MWVLILAGTLDVIHGEGDHEQGKERSEDECDDPSGGKAIHILIDSSFHQLFVSAIMKSNTDATAPTTNEQNIAVHDTNCRKNLYRVYPTIPPTQGQKWSSVSLVGDQYTHPVNTSSTVSRMMCSIGFDYLTRPAPSRISACFTYKHICTNSGIDSSCSFLSVILGSRDVSWSSEDDTEETCRHQQKEDCVAGEKSGWKSARGSSRITG
jgi:hypothetical protein